MGNGPETSPLHIDESADMFVVGARPRLNPWCLLYVALWPTIVIVFLVAFASGPNPLASPRREVLIGQLGIVVGMIALWALSYLLQPIRVLLLQLGGSEGLVIRGGQLLLVHHPRWLRPREESFALREIRELRVPYPDADRMGHKWGRHILWGSCPFYADGRASAWPFATRWPGSVMFEYREQLYGFGLTLGVTDAEKIISAIQAQAKALEARYTSQ